MHKTCIIGAGISGLALAWQIKRQGGDCTILEQASRVGGSMRSFRSGDYLAEEGPNSILLNSPEIEAFLLSIPGLKERMIDAAPEANKRFIVRNGKPHSVPMSPLSVLTTPLWSFRGKLRVLKEPFVKTIAAEKEESVADFVRRRLGNELYEYAINPLIGGIYAGDPEQLSLRYAFPKLYTLEQNHGGLIRGALAKMRHSKRSSKPKIKKRIISFTDGIGELPTKLADAIGESLRTSVSIKSIHQVGDKWEITSVTQKGEAVERFDQVILTTPAHRLAELPMSPEISESLKVLSEIDHPPVSVLSLAYKRKDIDHPLDGFGALVPACERRSILGALFPSSLFTGRAPNDEVLLTVFVGGERQPALATTDTATLRATVLPELEALLRIHGEPTFCHHKHWSKAIPQYKVGFGYYLDQMATLERKHKGLKLAGNYRSGISVTSCIEAALEFKV